MNTHFNNTPNEYKGEIKPNNSLIELKLNTEFTNNIIQYLISNNIPFSLEFSDTNQSKVVEKEKHPSENINPKKELSFQDTLQKYFNDHLEHTSPKLEDVARHLGISIQSFKTKFHKEFGHTFYQVYMEKKMAYAANLLKKGLTASAISERIGYSHPIKFNKMFQKHFGVTPKKYQLQFRGK